MDIVKQLRVYESYYPDTLPLQNRCKEAADTIELLRIDLATKDAEIDRLNAVIESNINDGIDKIMVMSDEQISALAGYEGKSPEDQATIGRLCMDIALLKTDLAAAREEIAENEAAMNHYEHAISLWRKFESDVEVKAVAESRELLGAHQLDSQRLRKRLKKYGEHLYHCDCVVDGEVIEDDEHDVCTCGFSEALALQPNQEALESYVAEKLATHQLVIQQMQEFIKQVRTITGGWWHEESARLLALQPTTDTLEAWYQERVKGELTAKDAEIERLKETIKRWNDGELEKPLEQLAAHQLAISQMREALLWYFDLYAESNVAHLLGKQTQTEALEAYVQAAIEKELESFAAVAATFYSDKNRAADTRGLFSAYAASARKDKQ